MLRFKTCWIYISIYIGTFFLLSIQYAQAQYVVNNCSVSRVIEIPFVADTGSLQHVSANQIKQESNYTDTDRFSYWYKLIVNEERFINCQIVPENPLNQYVIYIYKYKNNDFCDKLIAGKIKPVRVENEKNSRSIIEASEASDFTFKAKKGEVFYFCVLTVSAENCGHTLRLIVDSDTLTTTAYNLCGPEIKSNERLVKLKDLFKDADGKADYDTVLLAVQETNNPEKHLKAEVKITDIATQEYLKIDSSNLSQVKIIVERGKMYAVECHVTGYKIFNHTLDIKEYINSANKTFTIYLKPLKVGDNFVMEDIYFYPNTYALKDESLDALGGLLDYLLENTQVKIELQGHTNGNNKAKAKKSNKKKGSEWNYSGTAKKLSLLRAEEIKKYLVQKGVNKNNIKTVGFGGEKMIVSNPKSLEAAKKNARVEVVITDDGGL